MEKSEIKRIPLFDNIKYILGFFVVFGHMLGCVLNKLQESQYLYAAIYSFHMPLFLFISGIFSNKGKIDNRSKIVRYFLVYIYIMTINCIPCILLNRIDCIEMIGFGIEWYILSLIVYTIIVRYTNNHNKYLLVAIAIIFSLFLGYENRLGNIFSIQKIVYFLPFYLVGVYTDVDYIIFKMKKNRIICVLGGLLLIVCLVMIYVLCEKGYFWQIAFLEGGTDSYGAFLGNVTAVSCIYRLLAYCIGFIMIFSFLCIIPNKKYRLTEYGGRSLQVYVYHMVFVSFINYSWIDKMGEEIPRKYLLVLLIFSFAIWNGLSLFECRVLNALWRNGRIKSE